MRPSNVDVMAGFTYFRDARDETLIRSRNWTTDVCIPAAGAWRGWQVDWSGDSLTEISRAEAQRIAGPDADLDAPAAA